MKRERGGGDEKGGRKIECGGMCAYKRELEMVGGICGRGFLIG